MNKRNSFIFLSAALSFYFRIFRFVSLIVHLHLTTHCISSHSLIALYNPAFAPRLVKHADQLVFFVTCLV